MHPQKVYLFFDLRKVATNFIIISNEEMRAAISHLSSGAAWRLWGFYLLMLNRHARINKFGVPNAPKKLGLALVMEQTGLSRDSVYRALRQLREVGLITLTHPNGKGRWKDVIISLSIPAESEAQNEKNRNQKTT